jgi:two-component system sensor histidine kinase KdpD
MAERAKTPARPGWRQFALAVSLVAAATVTGRVGGHHLALPDLVMVYILVIMVAAAVCGRGPSLLAAALSVLSYDFFFIPPVYHFTVDDERHLLTFAMMFVIGIIISGLTLRIRRHEQAAQEATLRARTEEMRNALLSAVSHDLRTPLAAITGAATTLREADRAAGRDTDLVDTICEEADRLERLVRNLLDMTRLESGGVDLRREWVPVEEMVGSALNRLEAQLAGRPVRAALPAELPLVSVDPVLFEQVFVNLFENAAKYTPAGSLLEVTARADDGLTLEVADRGPGLPPGSEARIFDKFVRLEPTTRAGVGLGLSICRGIVEAHGGTLVAENRPGGGALFRLHLPAAPGAPSVPPEPALAETRGAPA